MKLFLTLMLMISVAVAKENAIANLWKNVQKNSILSSIDNYSNDNFTQAYLNVIYQLKKEKNHNAVKRLKSKEIFTFLYTHHRDMLKAIVNIKQPLLKGRRFLGTQ